MDELRLKHLNLVLITIVTDDCLCLFCNIVSCLDKTVSDFLNLQVGDCIRLDSKVDSDMDVFVGNIKKFTALPGAKDDSYAVQVTSVIREED